MLIHTYILYILDIYIWCKGPRATPDGKLADSEVTALIQIYATNGQMREDNKSLIAIQDIYSKNIHKRRSEAKAHGKKSEIVNDNQKDIFNCTTLMCLDSLIRLTAPISKRHEWAVDTWTAVRLRSVEKLHTLLLLFIGKYCNHFSDGYK